MPNLSTRCIHLFALKEECNIAVCWSLRSFPTSRCAGGRMWTSFTALSYPLSLLTLSKCFCRSAGSSTYLSPPFDIAACWQNCAVPLLTVQLNCLCSIFISGTTASRFSGRISTYFSHICAKCIAGHKIRHISLPI